MKTPTPHIQKQINDAMVLAASANRRDAMADALLNLGRVLTQLSIEMGDADFSEWFFSCPKPDQQTFDFALNAFQHSRTPEYQGMLKKAGIAYASKLNPASAIAPII